MIFVGVPSSLLLLLPRNIAQLFATFKSPILLLTADVIALFSTKNTEGLGKNSLNFQFLSSIYSYNHIFISIFPYLLPTHPRDLK